MDAKKAKDDLDAQTKRLRGLIRFSEKMADDLCEAGDAQNSSIMREVVGYLNLAYAKGRLLNASVGGGVIQPQFGGGK
jgi:hypothetical protein